MIFRKQPKQTCPSCNQTLKYLGKDMYFDYLTFYYCKEEDHSCKLNRRILMYENKKYKQLAALTVLREKPKRIYVYDSRLKENYWEVFR